MATAEHRIGRRSWSHRLAWSVWAVSVVVIVGGVVFQIISPSELTPDFLRSSPLDIVDNLTVVGLPTIGLLVATRRPENPLGWTFLIAGFGLGFGNGGIAYSIYALRVEPGLLPGGHLTGWLANWCWTFGVGTIPFLLLLFPNGRLLSKRWRPVAWVAGVASVTLLASAVVFATSSWSDPLATDEEIFASGLTRAIEPVFLGSLAAVMLCAFVGLVSTVLRFRRSRGDERLQMKWFTGAVAFLVVMLSGAQVSNSVVFDVASPISLVLLYGALAIAILKYRLYEIDVVINRAIVYGSLASLITAVYVAIVVGIGSLIGRGDEPNVVLSIAATAVVALAFGPTRSRVQHLANRLVYGERATPYEILASFSQRAAGTYAVDEVLPRTAVVLADATDADRASVWLKVGGEFVESATSLDAADELARVPVPDGELPVIDGADRVLGVRDRGELLGAISVHKRPGQTVTPAEDRLLEDLAEQAGLVLRNVRLTSELRARLDELSAQTAELQLSRHRIVAAHDAERRRLERNIHDGAQQNLVAMAVKLRLARAMAGKEPARARALISDLRSDTHATVQALRELSRGFYPQILEERGVAAALRPQADRSGLDVLIVAQGVQRHDVDIEAAVYFCCLEALQNATKYADASSITITLKENDESIEFLVTDDGRGFDSATTPEGSGLRNMRQRLSAFDGSVDVTSAPEHGTTVHGRVPMRTTGTS